MVIASDIRVGNVIRVDENGRRAMFKHASLCGLIVWILAMAPVAYAGKVELTTYYPAPMGDYDQLTANQAKIKKIAVGSTTSQPATEGNIVLASQSGAGKDPADANPPAGQIGEIAYSASKNALYSYNGATLGWQVTGKGALETVVGGRRGDGYIYGDTTIFSLREEDISGKLYKGIKCNAAAGWRRTGCNLTTQNGSATDADIVPRDEESCMMESGDITGAYDNLSIICMRLT